MRKRVAPRFPMSITMLPKHLKTCLAGGPAEVVLQGCSVEDGGHVASQLRLDLSDVVLGAPRQEKDGTWNGLNRILDEHLVSGSEFEGKVFRVTIEEVVRKELSPKPVTRKSSNKEILVEVVSGVEGPSVYLNGYRVCGPKPWGGGKVLHRWSCPRQDVERALKERT